MRVDHQVQPFAGVRASGRLRFSVAAPHRRGQFRLMVLDRAGLVQHRMSLTAESVQTPLQLTGFPRGEVFLVCAFHGDELVWSSPVVAG